MAETLLAILLVTTSAKGANLVFRWPPNPEAAPRLCRPKPDNQVFISQLDNPWRASLSHQNTSSSGVLAAKNGSDDVLSGSGVLGVGGTTDDRDYSTDPEYRWVRPGAASSEEQQRHRHQRHPRHPASVASSKTTSGMGNMKDQGKMSMGIGKRGDHEDPYEYMLGYTCEFLATLLCPQKSMCHQRFELIVDDLAFIGHPVCAEEGPSGPSVPGFGGATNVLGSTPSSSSASSSASASCATTPAVPVPAAGGVRWRFRPEKVKPNSRGREKDVFIQDGSSAHHHLHPREAGGANGHGRGTAVERKGVPVQMPGLGHHLATSAGASAFDTYHHHWTAHQQPHAPLQRPTPGSSVASSTAASPEKVLPATGAAQEPPAVESPSSSWLEKFQLVLVLDLPDPSSSESGNVAKYFDIIYEQIAFTFTAVLFQEQVLENFVESECDSLISLQEKMLKKEEPYEEFINQALQTSSIATAIKSVYDAVKSRSIAYISLNAIPLELQLPPHLDDLLHGEGDYDGDSIERPDDEDMQNWGPDLAFGWKLPGLAPWKSLLLLDGGSDLNASLRGGNVATEDRALAENLVRFLDTVNVTYSLADVGNSLDWDLEAQVYPIVRWLILHRRAKVVDTVNQGLKTIFALPAKFSAPLPKLVDEFHLKFRNNPEVPSLPEILASISSSLAKQSDNHFFASVVKKKDYIPTFQEVVEWMLRRDMLVTLHLRIRIVATRELKMRVFEARKSALERRERRRKALERAASLATSSSGCASVGGAGSKVGVGLRPPLRRGANATFDEFDEEQRGPEHGGNGSGGQSHAGSGGSGSTGSGSNKTPSRLTAFMSLSPPKRGLVMPSKGRAGSSSSKGGKRGLRRLSSTDSRGTSISELVIQEEEMDAMGVMSSFGDEDGEMEYLQEDGEDGDGVEGEQDGYLVDDDDGQGEDEEGEDETDLSGSDEEETVEASMINDPGRATPRQRRWLTEMSVGKEAHIAKRFEQINQYFDGKRSDDEILYRAEITRRQLREVLHHYEPYLQTFLHPS